MRSRLAILVAIVGPMLVGTLLGGAASGSIQQGSLIGPQLQPSQLAALAWNAGCWKTPGALVRAVAVSLSESQGFVRAINDNRLADGTLLSRDVGLMQINIPASAVGTRTELDLYVPEINLAKACDLYESRGFQPWVAFNSRVFLRDSYSAKAARGVGNWLAQGMRDERALDGKDETYVPRIDETKPLLGYLWWAEQMATDARTIRAAARKALRTSGLPAAARAELLVISALAAKINATPHVAIPPTSP